MAKRVQPNGVTPHLTIPDGRGQEAVEFYQHAFGATEEFRMTAKDGKRLLHADLRINSDLVMLNDDFSAPDGDQAHRSGGGIVIHLEVDDADNWWTRAIEAGAKPTMELGDQFWGARYGQLVDPFGYTWSIGSQLQ